MRRLAAFVIRRRWWVLITAMVFVPIAGLVGGGVARAVVGRRNGEPRRGVGPHRGEARARVRAGNHQLRRRRATAQRRHGRRSRGHRGRDGASPSGWSPIPSLVNVISYFSPGEATAIPEPRRPLALITAQIPGTEDEFVEAAGELAPRYTLDDAHVHERRRGRRRDPAPDHRDRPRTTSRRPRCSPRRSRPSRS